MHSSRGLPLISAEHEPHLPALQFQRTARSGACVACSRWMMSRTTSPSFTSTTKSCRSPDESSPRHTRNCALYPMSGFPPRVPRQFLAGLVLLQLADLEELEQLLAHRELWLLDDGHVRPVRRAHQEFVAPVRVHRRVVVAGVPAAALLPQQRGPGDALADQDHVVQVDREMPAGVELAVALHRDVRDPRLDR